MKSKTLKTISYLLGWAAFLLIWEFLSRRGIINRLYIGSPEGVLNSGMNLFRTGEIYGHLAASFSAYASSMVLVILVGWIMGLLVGTSPRLYKLIQPYMAGLNALPKVALIPLVIIWFGIGLLAKSAVIFLLAFPPFMMITMEAARNADKELVGMARSFGAGQRDINRKIVFFDTLPDVFAGMKIALGEGVKGMVIAELFGYGVGLGYLINFYGNVYDTDGLIFIMILLLLIAWLLNVIITWIERKTIIWKHE